MCRLLFVDGVCCVLFVGCVLFVVWYCVRDCSLFVDYCMLFVVWFVGYVGCCLVLGDNCVLVAG